MYTEKQGSEETYRVVVHYILVVYSKHTPLQERATATKQNPNRRQRGLCIHTFACVCVCVHMLVCQGLLAAVVSRSAFGRTKVIKATRTTSASDKISEQASGRTTSLPAHLSEAPLEHAIY